jgi:hypothetical protein
MAMLSGAAGGANGNANHNTNTNNNGPNNAMGASSTGGGEAHLDSGNGAILARLKELEAINQTLQKTVEETKAEAHRKEEKIKELSIEKRKEMETLINTAIDTWLNSLPDLSEEIKKQFRAGISRIAETADTRNAAWEVVCNASRLHTANVNRIEELISTCNQQSETIKTLVGGGGGEGVTALHNATFEAESARIQTTAGGAAPISAHSGHKRARMETETAAAHANSSEHHNFKDAWDAFGTLLTQNGRQSYGW